MKGDFNKLLMFIVEVEGCVNAQWVREQVVVLDVPSDFAGRTILYAVTCALPALRGGVGGAHW